MKSAIVFGASGLVGSELVKELISNKIYDTIYLIIRSTVSTESDKIKLVISDFSNLNNDLKEIHATDAFICLGTTIKKAGSIEAMEQIDRDLPLKIAELLKANKTEKLAVVSSIGANRSSKNYYLRIKGEMEHGLIELGFEQLAIVRPSIILGKRKEKRLGEKLGKALIKVFGVFLVGNLNKYKGIQARTIARSMINILNNKLSETIFESDQLQKLGKQSARNNGY